MVIVTVSSKGQIAIPKLVRDVLNLGAGSRLSLEVRGGQIVLGKEPAWKKLRGAGADPQMMVQFESWRRCERDAEDSHS